MTLTNRLAVSVALKDPRIKRVYRYEHSKSGDTLYAAFVKPEDDDTDTAPNVYRKKLLKDNGELTELAEKYFNINLVKCVDCGHPLSDLEVMVNDESGRCFSCYQFFEG